MGYTQLVVQVVFCGLVCATPSGSDVLIFVDYKCVNPSDSKI